jgi:hypothetical protein
MFAASARRGRTAARTTFGRTVRRACGREPNPLCRRVDRSRSRLLLALALALAASLAAALLVGLASLHAQQAHVRQLAAHRHRITATTVSAATDDLSRVSVQFQAQAVWDYPPSGHHSGWITVPLGTTTGSTVPVLVDDRGNAVSDPPTATRIAANAVFAGVGTLALALVAAELGYTLRRRALDRRAERSWEPEWEQVEPHWSGRNRRHPENGQP